LELFIGIINASENITFTMTAQSEVWGANKWADDLMLTDMYSASEWTADYTRISTTSWKGWNFVLSQDYGGGYPVYGYGLYKFSKDENHYFYLDYRDERFGAYESFGYPYGHPADLWIKYNAGLDSFYYSSTRYDPWIPINNGDYLPIWEIKQMEDPTRDRFQPTTPFNLAITWFNNRPLLNWHCSEPRSAATYEV